MQSRIFNDINSTRKEQVCAASRRENLHVVRRLLKLGPLNDPLLPQELKGINKTGVLGLGMPISPVVCGIPEHEYNFYLIYPMS